MNNETAAIANSTGFCWRQGRHFYSRSAGDGFLLKAWRRGLELGISQSTLKKVAAMPLTLPSPFLPGIIIMSA